MSYSKLVISLNNGHHSLEGWKMYNKIVFHHDKNFVDIQELPYDSPFTDFSEDGTGYRCESIKRISFDGNVIFNLVDTDDKNTEFNIFEFSVWSRDHSHLTSVDDLLIQRSVNKDNTSVYKCKFGDWNGNGYYGTKEFDKMDGLYDFEYTNDLSNSSKMRFKPTQDAEYCEQTFKPCIQDMATIEMLQNPLHNSSTYDITIPSIIFETEKGKYKYVPCAYTSNGKCLYDFYCETVDDFMLQGRNEMGDILTPGVPARSIVESEDKSYVTVTVK